MKLSDLNPTELAALAEAVPTNVDYLRHVAKGRRNASITMAVKIERASGDKIGRETLVSACQTCKYRRRCKGK